MKKLLLALALLLAPSLAYGQCNGIYAANQVCGSLAGGPAGPVAAGSILPTFGINTQTSNYTIVSNDCANQVQAGTGSSGFFTITLPAANTVPTGCRITVTNGDTGRAKALSGFPSPSFAYLYPSQTEIVQSNGTVWLPISLPGRWRIQGATTFFVDNSLGSDSNDCLATGAGACLNASTMFNRIRNNVDGNSQVITAQFASGQTWNNVIFASTAFVTGDIGTAFITIDGGSGTFTSSTASPALTISADRGWNVTIQNVMLTNSGSGDAYDCLQGASTFGTGVTFGTTSAYHINVVGGSCVVTMNANYTISGNAQRHYFIQAGPSQLVLNTITVTLTGTPAFSSAFAYSWNSGLIFSNNSVTYSGAATGVRYIAIDNGVVNTNGGGANFFPGNAAGQSFRGGDYDSPGTPTVSSCGTTPGTPNGKDLAGNVTEGTTATGCTINFTTGNTKTSCSVNISNATAQAGLVITTLSSSTLVVTHPSVSSAVLYWTCPAT